MLLNRTTFSLCAGLLVATACTHDSKRAESQASAAQMGKVEEQRVAATDPVMEPRAPQDPTLASQLPRTTPTTTGEGATTQADACELAVYFATDSAKLNADSRGRLDTVADCMKRREVDHATIVGQTDPSGTAEHNQKLGLERAKAVAEYLRDRGVPADQIRVQSKGELATAEQPQQLWPVARRAGVDAK
ncbi:MAG: OmpA family protein [Polyangiales bacterium]